jgi:septum site-determining protein MinC
MKERSLQNMKKNSVVLKGNKYGIVVVLDEAADFEEIKDSISEKFKESSKFFGKESMAIAFEGKNLTDDEQVELLNIVNETTDLNIVCIMDNDKDKEEKFKKTVEAKLEDLNTGVGQFYRGTLRSGQVLESDSSVIILGDVNPGAKIISAGNIVILGALKGNVYAGAKGDENSFVVALYMNPVQIRIGDIIARCSDKPKKLSKPETKIAYVDGGNIYIDPLNKEVLSELNL